MDPRRIGMTFFALAVIALLVGLAVNWDAYGEAAKGYRDWVNVIWDFDDRSPRDLYVPSDWTFFSGVFNAIALGLAVIGAVAFFGARKP